LIIDLPQISDSLSGRCFDSVQRRTYITNAAGKKMPADESGLNPILWGSWRRQTHDAARWHGLPIFIGNKLYHESE
jgi:hypothetical protein